MTSLSKFLSALLLIFFFSACNNNYTPKPTGYFRISFPEKSYDSISENFPFSCLIPQYASISFIANPDSNLWYNLEFPDYNAKVHLSFYEIDTCLSTYIESSREFAIQHIPKATAIKQKIISIPQHSVYGLYYNIQGSETASPIQFYLTDSVNYFLRGALYFNNTPNNDSLQPVIEFIDSDIVTMMESFRWK